MTKESRGLRRFSSKAVKVLVATAMGAMLVPAAAFAHYEPIESNKALLSSEGHDPLNDGVKRVSEGNNTVTYMGYAHSDLTYYTMYSLYTAITYDKNGIVTGVDLTSGNDTFSGAWGYLIGKQTKDNPVVLEGYLPAGVKFDEGKTVADDGTVTLKPQLTGAVDYGFSIYNVALMKVTKNSAESEIRATDTDEDGTKGGTWDTRTGNNATITVTDNAVNLVKITYQIGQEKIYFNTYVTFDEAAESYVDYVGVTEYIEDYDALLKHMASDEYSGTGTTNRNRWTTICATVMLRQLASWGTTLSMSDSAAEASGEVTELDTVSGATKTSDPMVKALNQAYTDGYIKGVADDVVVTIDGGTDYEINANENLMDQTTVTLNNEGQYVLSSAFPAGDTLKRSDTHGVTLKSITLYGLSDKTVGTGDVLKLAKGNSSYEPLVTYTPESLKLNETETTGKGGTSISYSWVPKGTEAGKYLTLIDDDLITFDYENSDEPLIVTAKSDKVTHVVFEYELGHDQIALAYDLASMKAAGDVEAAIEALDASDAAEVKQVRAAYDALPYDVHCFVSNLSKLTAAEANLPADNDNGNNNAPKVTSVIKAGVTYKVSGKVAQVTKVAKSKKSATIAKTVKIGSKTYKVSKIKAKALKGTKVTKLTIKSTTLTKAGVKNSLKGSKVKTVKVPKAKKAKYTKIFKKANSGKKVTVK